VHDAKRRKLWLESAPGQSMSAAIYRLHLLGPFALYAPDGARIHVPSRKGMALLAMLALSRNGQRSRSWLQDRLWGTRDREQASASLRREVHNLRAHFSCPPVGVPVGGDAHSVRLDLGRVESDIRRLDDDLTAGRPCPAMGYGELLEGLDLEGEEGFEDWLREQRMLAVGLVEQAGLMAWRRDALAKERPEPELTPAVLLAGRAPPLPIRPSICVRRFEALSGPVPFALALSEHIAMALSEWSTLMVVAAGPDDHRMTDRAALCRLRGVRYLLEGTVQQAGDQLRVSVHLIDGVLSEKLWSATFDDCLANAFAVQDRIAGEVAPLIDSSIDKSERRRLPTQPVAALDAHDLYWRANALMRLWEPDATRQAIALAEQVLVLEPANAWAASLAAFGYAALLVQGAAEAPEVAQRKARDHFETAMRTGSEDPHVLGNAAGSLIGCGGDLAVAEALLERALELNPNMPATLFWAGSVDIAAGRLERAADRFLAALRLNPDMAVRSYVLTGLGLALVGQGRPAEARPILVEAAAQLPHFALTQMAAACCATLLGNAAEASAAKRRLEASGGLAAAFRVVRDPAQQAAISGLLEGVAVGHAPGPSDQPPRTESIVHEHRSDRGLQQGVADAPPPSGPR
jgi:TolB-like protein